MFSISHAHWSVSEEIGGNRTEKDKVYHPTGCGDANTKLL